MLWAFYRSRPHDAPFAASPLVLMFFVAVLRCMTHRHIVFVLSSQTAEDKAVNKALQQAAIAAAANTERTDTSPQVTMREGQKEFVAASDPKATHGKEHVTTEADIVAVRKDMESGDRVVEPKSKPKTPATKLAVKVRAVYTVTQDHAVIVPSVCLLANHRTRTTVYRVPIVPPRHLVTTRSNNLLDEMLTASNSTHDHALLDSRAQPEVEDVEEATREGTEDGEKETDGEDGGVELTVSSMTVYQRSTSQIKTLDIGRKE